MGIMTEFRVKMTQGSNTVVLPHLSLWVGFDRSIFIPYIITVHGIFAVSFEPAWLRASVLSGFINRFPRGGIGKSMRILTMISCITLLIVLLIVMFFWSNGLWFVDKTEGKSELLEHRHLLQEQRYDLLEERLRAFNDGYLTGTISIRDYYWSTESVWASRDVGAEWLEAALADWLEKKPKSAYALIFASRYQAAKAYKARGTKPASTTPPDQFALMEEHLTAAESLVKAGLAIDSNVLEGYSRMPAMMRSSSRRRSGMGLSDALLLYVETVPENIRRTEVIWSLLLQASAPRWGGSYQDMNSLLENYALNAIAEVTPQQEQALRDAIVYDQASLAIQAKDYARALDMLRESLEANTPYAGIYVLASTAASKIGDHQKCFEYATSATQLRPWRSDSWNNLGRCAIELQLWPVANNAFRHRVYLDGESRYRVFQLGLTHMYLHEYDKAYALFRRAEELDPDYVKYTKQYTDYIESKKPEDMALLGTSARKIVGALLYNREGVIE